VNNCLAANFEAIGNELRYREWVASIEGCFAYLSCRPHEVFDADEHATAANHDPGDEDPVR
jgi:hypothetical protein